MSLSTDTAILNEIIQSIPNWRDHHNKQSIEYQTVSAKARKEVCRLFAAESTADCEIACIGKFSFPFFKMGTINSLDLFGLDELIIFSFYKQNQHRYNKVLDLGANIGLHSVILGKLGFHVDAYEPDPVHYQILTQNLKRNHIKNVHCHQAAVSTHHGKANFTRVLGNTTSSHLTGAKNPYGALEHFEVNVVDIRDLLVDVDFVKMDVEGHEIEILQSLKNSHFSKTDWMLEVSTEENMIKIHSLLQKSEVNAFSQKTGWKKVSSLMDLPATHREGSLFLTSKQEMPW